MGNIQFAWDGRKAQVGATSHALLRGSAETAGSAVGAKLSRLGADVTRRNLNVQPTIKVHAGHRFNVRVNRDLV